MNHTEKTMAMIKLYIGEFKVLSHKDMAIAKMNVINNIAST